MTFQKALSYDDISIVPRVISELKHRSEADTSIECFGIKLDIPMISSPMPDVTNGEMAHSLTKLEVLGIVHRFQSIEEQTKEYKWATRRYNKHYFDSINSSGALNCMSYAACAIGITGDYQERFGKLYRAGCRIFCLDVANGANKQVEEAVKWIREWEIKNGYETCSITREQELADRVYLICGNIATKEGYRYLTNLGVDAVRVGIASGQPCTTKNETGVYMPMISSILECVEERRKIAHENSWPKELKDKTIGYKSEEYRKLPIIIADGGIRTPSDMCKALALGADLIMCGSIFVPTDESPAEIIKFDNKLYKKYRGAASFGVQKEYTGEKPEYNEGDETLILYERNTSVGRVIKRFKAGLQSSLSYLNSRNLLEFRKNASFVEI